MPVQSLGPSLRADTLHQKTPIRIFEGVSSLTNRACYLREESALLKLFIARRQTKMLYLATAHDLLCHGQTQVAHEVFTLYEDNVL